MKTAGWLGLALMALAGAASAQNAPLTGVAESTDPATIDRIEQRAQELAARPQVPEQAAKTHTKTPRSHKAKPAASVPAASNG